MLRFLTAGESHGRGLVAVIEGLPAGLRLEAGAIDSRLRRRQGGYGRGGRMKIEEDRAEILSGVRHGLTLGSPVSLLIWNRDWENWREVMDPAGPGGGDDRRVTAPRPGHADLAGGMKYGFRDLRDVLERSSARETAARVAAGAVFQELLERFGVRLAGMVEEIGGAAAAVPEELSDAVLELVERSPFRCPDPGSEAGLKARVDQAAASGDTVGGIFQVRARGLVPGLGSHVHWDRRLDARLAGALMSVPGVKGVEVGLGFRGAGLPGSLFHDEIEPAGEGAGHPWRYARRSNRAGGVEGGMATGEDLVTRAFMKPIPTLGKPLSTVDLETGGAASAHRERGDVCAVPAASVVGEAMVAWVLAGAYLEKFGSDTLEEALEGLARYRVRLGKY